jgi:hypothetical protein
MMYPPTASESPLARFPSYPAWDALRELADQLLEYDGVATVYLDLAPTEVGEVRDRAQHARALSDELRRLVGAAEKATSEHERKRGLRSLSERVDGFLAGYEPAGRHIHGVAVFATPDGYFRAIELPEAVRDMVSLERSPRIAPLISLVARTHEALLVMVDHEHGTMLVSAEGAVRESETWSGARTVADHLKRVAEGVSRATREEPRPIVLVGVEDVRGEFSRYLDVESRKLVAGWTSVEPHQPPERVAAAARPLLEDWWGAREREMLDSWHEAAAKHTHGVAGFEDTLSAAADGAVDVLLFQDEPKVDWPVAFECENDGRAYLTPGECPLDGGALVPRRPGLEVVIRETLRYGGKAFAIQGAEDLARARGVGAMTRF